MTNETVVPAYGLWSLVIINSAIFISCFKPTSRRDWRTFGGCSAFLIKRAFFPRVERAGHSVGSQEHARV